MSVINKVASFTDKHAPDILVGVGIAGMVTTVVLSVAATPKAMKSIEEKKKQLNKTKLTIWQTVSAGWKYYVGPTVVGLASIGCFLGSNGIQNKRNLNLATACAILETSSRRYAEKVIETIGEKKEQQIRDKMAEEDIKKNPARGQEVMCTAGGDTLCYDSKNKIYFKSSWNKIKNAENAVNAQLNTSEDPDLFVPLNDFFYELGLPMTDYGKMVGWKRDSGYLKISRSSQLTDDGTPVLVFDYSYSAKYGRYD